MERHLYEALENPFWAALTSTHAAHAQDVGALKRFAPDVALAMMQTLQSEIAALKRQLAERATLRPE